MALPEGVSSRTYFSFEDSGDGIADYAATRRIKEAYFGRYQTYEDTSFVTGESPATHDVNTDLGRNGRAGYIVNDGDGNIQVDISDDGTNYGDKATIKKGDVFDLNGLNIDSIRMTWVANSAYRIMVI